MIVSASLRKERSTCDTKLGWFFLVVRRFRENIFNLEQTNRKEDWRKLFLVMKNDENFRLRLWDCELYWAEEEFDSVNQREHLKNLCFSVINESFNDKIQSFKYKTTRRKLQQSSVNEYWYCLYILNINKETPTFNDNSVSSSTRDKEV